MKPLQVLVVEDDADLAEAIAEALELVGHSATVAGSGDLGRPDEAIRSFRVASGITPNDPEIPNNLGGLLARRGELEAAEEHLRIAIQLSPDYAHPHYNLGQLLKGQGRVDEGQEHFERAAALDPSYADPVR